MLANNGYNKKYDLNVKVLLIGDSGVGKTSLMVQFAEDKFSTSFITTVGIDYKYKFVDINGKRIRLEIWDTAGQERFKAITTAYLRGAQGILLCYDVTDRKSFTHVDNWVNQIKQYADLNVDKVLIGNKCDLEGKRAVSIEEGEALAKQHNMPFFETSAKANLNVDKAFDQLGRLIVDRIGMNNVVVEPTTPNLTEEPAQSSCCK